MMVQAEGGESKNGRAHGAVKGVWVGGGPSLRSIFHDSPSAQLCAASAPRCYALRCADWAPSRFLCRYEGNSLFQHHKTAVLVRATVCRFPSHITIAPSPTSG